MANIKEALAIVETLKAEGEANGYSQSIELQILSQLDIADEEDSKLERALRRLKRNL